MTLLVPNTFLLRIIQKAGKHQISLFYFICTFKIILYSKIFSMNDRLDLFQNFNKPLNSPNIKVVKLVVLVSWWYVPYLCKINNSFVASFVQKGWRATAAPKPIPRIVHVRLLKGIVSTKWPVQVPSPASLFQNKSPSLVCRTNQLSKCLQNAQLLKNSCIKLQNILYLVLS